MAESEKDRASKEKIAAGMAEAGKGQVKGGGEAGKGGPGHGADPGKLVEGMAEAGSGAGDRGRCSFGRGREAVATVNRNERMRPPARCVAATRSAPGGTQGAQADQRQPGPPRSRMTPRPGPR